MKKKKATKRAKRRTDPKAKLRRATTAHIARVHELIEESRSVMLAKLEQIRTQTDPKYMRRSVLGLGALHQLAPGATEVLSPAHSLAHAFIPDRLLLMPSRAGLVIDSIKVGNREQLMAGGVPAELFSVRSQGGDAFDPITRETSVQVVLRNSTAEMLSLATAGFVGRLETDLERGYRLQKEVDALREELAALRAQSQLTAATEQHPVADA